MAQPSGAVRPVRQLRPAGGWQMPKIRLPHGQFLLYGAAGVVAILAVVLLLGQLKNDQSPASANAIWLGTEWTYDQPTDEALRSLADRLRDHQIGTVYAWVSLLQPNGAWSDTLKLDNVRAFTDRFRQAYPQMTLYGWLSVAAQNEEGNNRLAEAALQQQVADFSARLARELGFDGVFLNIVPVGNGDEGYLGLLRKVRQSIGDSTPLAVAVPPDWTPDDPDVPQPPLIAPGTVWETAYKQRVALIADQMVITAYNSGLTSAIDYTAWVAYQVRTFAQSLAELETNTNLLIGVPSYDTVSDEHDPAVENILTAATGIRDGLVQAGSAASYVRGAAIYAEWDTDDDDWRQFKNTWVNR